MTERSRPWTGTVAGDAGPYTFDYWTDLLRSMAGALASTGVLFGEGDGLALTGLPSTPISIGTGTALVDGTFYRSDAAVSVTIPTPSANPRIDRIVLRKGWAAQTVRITRIAGSEAASPVPPAITQTDGVTWDLPLWQVRVTTGGAITIERDERSFLPLGLQPAVGQAQNLLRGGDMESWSAGAAAAPDAWTLVGSGASVAREGTIVKRGTYSAALTRGGTDCYIGQDAVAMAGGTSFGQGRTFTLGAWVYATVALRARLSIYDGVGTTAGASHSGSSDWEWLTITRTLDASASSLQTRFEVVNGDTTGYVCGAILVEGSFCPAFYPHPNDQHLRISNYQSNTPTDYVDQGIWRAEIGNAQLVGDTGNADVEKAVTFQTAFRVLRVVVASGDSVVGNSRVTWSVDTFATTGFKVKASTLDEAVFADTSTGESYWIATGQV